jgi:hypothetical protein
MAGSSCCGSRGDMHPTAGIHVEKVLDVGETLS